MGKFKLWNPKLLNVLKWATIVVAEDEDVHCLGAKVRITCAGAARILKSMWGHRGSAPDTEMPGHSV